MGGGEATSPGAKVIQRIIFKPEARFDVAEAYKWYEQRDPGLGAEFMRTIDSCVHQIQRHPEMYPIVHKNVRQALARRFPYSIFYLVEGDTAYVVSVFHTSRDPRNWTDRI
jgi:plasmid stabilization system protein ParE